jgi:nitrate reductase gamma subunit
MSGLTIFFVIYAYVAVAVFIIGFLFRIWKYGRTPDPVRIAQTPAPVSSAGVGGRYVWEVGIFKSLLKGNRVIWISGYIFHLGLLFALVKHYRFFFSYAPLWLDYFTTFEMYAGLIMLGGLALLFILRLVVDRTVYISIMNDYLLLILLMGIAFTGYTLKHFTRTNVTEVKEFVLGIVSFNPQQMPSQAMFIIHISLVFLFLMYFPFSKLMHAGGIFFSPTRNMVDNPRDKRTINPWGKKPETIEIPSNMTQEEG